VLAALHLSQPDTRELSRLNDASWREALDFSDRWQLTLTLRGLAGIGKPSWARERMEQNAAHNVERNERLEELYRAIVGTLVRSDIDFVALKGLTHCPDFGSRPVERTQCDIDLYVPQYIEDARDAVAALGYESMEKLEDFPTGHLPPLIRKTGWQWKGDYYDPDIPFGIELHFEWWNEDVEHLRVPGLEAFWQRRMRRRIAGIPMPVLAPADALGYACLHLLKHVLRGSARPFHVLEVARFLDARSADDEFWQNWDAAHSPELRRLEAVMFRLAHAWFGPAMHPHVEQEMRALPAGTRAWFDEFALSPAAGLFRSNKDELWLHASLLESRSAIASVARRRLFPERLPSPVDATHLPESEMTWRRRALKHLRYAAYVAERLRHHAASMPRVAMAGLRWRRRLREMDTTA